MKQARDDRDREHELVFWSATRLARAIRERELSSHEVVTAHLRRIKAVNPKINALVQLAEERALDEAQRADREISRGNRMGPLHGVPFTIKDSFDTEGIVSTGGTPGRAAFVPDADAVVVARLRASGAILLGKTNTPELTIGSETENALYGRTNNPYDLARSPSGSSGGAAALIAAGGSPLDIGSDTGGSIREPAHVCGIAALKPTLGRVPRTGHILPAAIGAVGSLTQVGPMARYVEDLELVLPIISGVDWCDPAVVPMPLRHHADVELARLRVASFSRIANLVPEPAIEQAIHAAASALASAGVRVTNDCPEAIADAGTLYARLRNADGGAHLKRLVDRAGTGNPGPRVAARLTGLAALDGEEFSAIIEAVDRFRSRMLHFMRGYDAILCPPGVKTAWLHDAVADDSYESWAFATAFNLTGWPAAVVRAGSTGDGLPVGIQVVGRPWCEDVVFALAMRIEALTGGYARPDV